MKTLITGALALALLASAAPAALAQERPDRQSEDGRRGPGAGWAEHQHQAPPQAAPQAAPQPAPRPAVAPPAAAAGQVQAGPRGYYRPDGQGGYRGQFDNRGLAGQPQTPARPPMQAAPVPGQPPVAAREWRGDRGAWQHDPARPPQTAPQLAPRDDRYRQGDRYRQDNRYRQDQDRRYDNGRRYDNDRRDNDRREDWRRYDGRGPGQDWQRDRPHYDRREYPFRFDNHQRYRGFAYYAPRGFYVRHWGFGDIVPRSWWGPDYRLNDWWSYGLPIPPVGYEWVRVGDDALLIDIFSGRVVQVAYDLFY